MGTRFGSPREPPRQLIRRSIIDVETNLRRIFHGAFSFSFSSTTLGGPELRGSSWTLNPGGTPAEISTTFVLRPSIRLFRWLASPDVSSNGYRSFWKQEWGHALELANFVLSSKLYFYFPLIFCHHAIDHPFVSRFYPMKGSKLFAEEEEGTVNLTLK